VVNARSTLLDAENASRQAARTTPGPERTLVEGSERAAADPEASVQVLLPVSRYTTLRAGNRLIRWVMPRRGQGRSVVELVGGVVPVPVLARLEALHERMAAAVCMFAGVLGWR
jgi:hypothetical protein